MEREELSSMVERILKNPEFAGMVSQLQGEEKGAANPDEMLKKVPDVVNLVSAMMGGTGNDDEKAEPKDEKRKENEHPLPSQNTGKNVQKKYDASKAERLLLALKPYLNENRCGIIEKCVSVMKVSDIVGTIDGLEWLLGNKEGK